MKKYSTKLKYDFAEALVEVIAEALVQITPADDDDRLFLAALAEVKTRLQTKLVTWRPAYTVSFSPVQALSLRLLYTDEFRGQSPTYTGNRLRQIADEIHQHYS